MWSAACLLACPLGQAFEGAEPDGVPALVLWSCVPLLLSALSLCLWCAGFEICLYSYFEGVLARFMVLVWVCVVLVLCVACVAFVCVRG